MHGGNNNNINFSYEMNGHWPEWKKDYEVILDHSLKLSQQCIEVKN